MANGPIAVATYKTNWTSGNFFYKNIDNSTMHRILQKGSWSSSDKCDIRELPKQPNIPMFYKNVVLLFRNKGLITLQVDILTYFEWHSDKSGNHFQSVEEYYVISNVETKIYEALW
jgi:hypothetical protein